MATQPVFSRIDRMLSNPLIDDMVSIKKPYQPCIVDLATLDKLYLQTIPREIRVNPDSNWVAIASMGRNNPLYHFTGSEDTIEFEISWYSDYYNRKDVLTKCKWLEALSKADGYNKPPSAIKFIYGDLFKNSKFIVAKAPYTLSLFNREFQMMPLLAVQQITLKRITTTNLTRNEITKLDT